MSKYYCLLCGRPLRWGEIDICDYCGGRKMMKDTVAGSHEKKFEEVFK